MRIFLIGMPGSGKSYWMPLLAKALGYNCIDLDVYIEQEQGESIPRIFAKGEVYFRNIERQALLQLLKKEKDKLIIATGGGLPAYQDNMSLLKEAGCVIYVYTSLQKIADRIYYSKDTRPLLTATNQEELLLKLQKLYESRKEIYEQAHLKIDVTSISLSTFVEHIKQYLV